jgi:hypothetical protein
MAFLCDYCGKDIALLQRGTREGEFRLVRLDSEYCSPLCRQRAHRQRLRGAPLRDAAGVGLNPRKRP